MASGPITSWQIDGETVADLIFLSSRITADGDCSHETERHLLLKRKAMTNLDNILQSRDIILLAKVCLAKAIVRGVCNFLGSVSSQEKFEATDVEALSASQLLDSVTAQFYLENKGKYILEAWGHANPKGMKRRERERERECMHGRETPPSSPDIGPLFLYVFSSPGPVLCKLG